MDVIARSCVLFLLLQTLITVTSQEYCTLQEFLTSALYDSNFDTTGLADVYLNGKQVRVPCIDGYSGHFQLLCVEGRWEARGFKCQQYCTLQEFLTSELYDSNFDTTGLADVYLNGKQVRVPCIDGYSGHFQLLCVEGRWTAQGSKCQQYCTLQEFLTSELYDSNFDTTGLADVYLNGKQVRVPCIDGYSGHFQLLCVEGRWAAQGSKCQQ
ncbi:uncharacterized protein LOC131983290 [Centropristis striata]|uniref:uncharacterized protein LOC131983290 n=1 Tax=Centropristis striata TaxID=184440 RepID=UPI0027DFDF78|nr:uncharacterized protein LOC131983290 [Centropristis striata]